MMSKNIKKNIFSIPEHDKGVLIEPALHLSTNLVENNKKKTTGYNFTLCGIDYNTIRDKVRYEIIEKARLYTKNLLEGLNGSSNAASCLDNRDQDLRSATLFQTGHAPVLYTPGVWIKNHIVNRLANVHNGIGINVVMDNDIPKDSFFMSSGINSDKHKLEKSNVKGASGKLPYEELSVPLSSNGDINSNVDNDFAKMVFSDVTERCSMFLDDTEKHLLLNRFMELITASSVSKDNPGERLTYARRIFEKGFNLNNLEIPVSKVCETDGFYVFFLGIVKEYQRFCHIYNQQLERYRKENKIRSTANPLPNLRIDGCFAELPFWGWKANGSRQKLYAGKRDDGYVDLLTDPLPISDACNGDITDLVTLCKLSLHDNTKNIVELRELLLNGFKIRPKAVTNTMFSRLFFSDVFVHGVGGAKYDIITDGIIKDFFGVVPPEYIAASATLYPPYKRFDVKDDDLVRLQNEIKKIRNNPDKYIPNEVLNESVTKELISEKMELIGNVTGGDKSDAKRRFLRIKEINMLLNDKIKHLFEEKELEISSIKDQLMHNDVVNKRDHPIFVYPEEFIKDFFSEALSVEG